MKRKESFHQDFRASPLLRNIRGDQSFPLVVGFLLNHKCPPSLAFDASGFLQTSQHMCVVSFFIGSIRHCTADSSKPPWFLQRKVEISPGKICPLLNHLEVRIPFRSYTATPLPEDRRIEQPRKRETSGKETMRCQPSRKWEEHQLVETITSQHLPVHKLLEVDAVEACLWGRECIFREVSFSATS